jgi:uncharacterized membrane protein SpoIIM required for sporulation
VPAPTLSSRWIEKRQGHWARLEALLARGYRGVSRLTHEEVRELALLYRQTAADLSTAREHRADAQLAAYLNQLLARAHNLIYSGRAPRSRGLLAFYTRTFPQVFRATWRYTMAATMLFLLGACTGTVIALADPGFERFVLGGHMMDTIERREMWTHGILTVKPLASSAILTNNLSVAFAAFAMGVTAGLGTAWMMVLNGLLIGVVGVACFRAGMSLSLWSFVAPHGSLELPAIFLAGGAGLLIGRGLLDPGALPRREALADAGRRAVRLLLGVIPLLIAAGVIEGFISPEPIPATSKFVIGAALLILLVLYLTRAGRTATTDPAP